MYTTWIPYEKIGRKGKGWLRIPAMPNIITLDRFQGTGILLHARERSLEDETTGRAKTTKISTYYMPVLPATATTLDRNQIIRSLFQEQKMSPDGWEKDSAVYEIYARKVFDNRWDLLLLPYEISAEDVNLCQVKPLLDLGYCDFLEHEINRDNKGAELLGVYIYQDIVGLLEGKVTPQ